MRVTTAQHPGPDHSDDRIFTAPDLVIMLDGASAITNTDVPAAVYVDHLGPALTDGIISRPHASLANALGKAIAQTADTLKLDRGTAPSSTVAIVRARSDSIDALVLGDTQIVTPARIIRDDRIARIGTDQQATYQARLRDGRGYDPDHRALLKALQEAQRRHRNRQDGYWIAEANPAASGQAIVEQLEPHDTPWLVLATDGAYRPMGHLRLDDWPRIADLDQVDLAALLDRCQGWESETDPNGAALPRAKRHDDKSIAVVNLRDE